MPEVKRFTLWIQLLHPQKEQVLNKYPNLTSDVRLSVARFDMVSDPTEWDEDEYRGVIEDKLVDGLDSTNPEYFPLDPENDYKLALVLYDRWAEEPRKGEIYRTSEIEIPDKYMQ